MEKAYKLLAIQENISNGQAKKLIDDGMVYASGKKITIARALINPKTKFKIMQAEKATKIFEDENMIVVNKPAFVVSESLEKVFNAQLLHRLDKETSGVLVLVKDEEFRQKAIEAFKKQEVYKEYVAIVSGILSEEMTIDLPIKTVKGDKARSVVSKQGLTAETIVTPLEIEGKKSKVSAVIKTGRTHQIRVHLSAKGHPIIGDTKYGGKQYNRMLLHSKKMKLFEYEFEAPEPKEFASYMAHH